MYVDLASKELRHYQGHLKEDEAEVLNYGLRIFNENYPLRARFMLSFARYQRHMAMRGIEGAQSNQRVLIDLDPQSAPDFLAAAEHYLTDPNNPPIFITNADPPYDPESRKAKDAAVAVSIAVTLKRQLEEVVDGNRAALEAINAALQTD